MFFAALGTVVVFECSALRANAAFADSIPGYTQTSSPKQAAIETQFKAIPTPSETKRQHRLFTAEPHPAGSERNNYLARYIAEEWKKQGLEDVVIRRYDVFSSDPQETLLEMVSPVPYRANCAKRRMRPIPTPRTHASVPPGWACPSPGTSPRR